MKKIVLKPELADIPAKDGKPAVPGRPSDKDILTALIGSTSGAMTIQQMAVAYDALKAIESADGFLVMKGEHYVYILERFTEPRFKQVTDYVLDLYDRLKGAVDYEPQQAVPPLDITGNSR